MEREYIDLYEFQTRLKEGIESFFPTRIWLRAEVSAVKARNGGHCYIELSQSGPEGLVAKVNAAIWRSKYSVLAPYFESVAGSPLKEGMQVLVQVQVSYSQLYGFTLVINDIDPEYSLGQKEMEKQKTIERLNREGIMDLQQSLSLPQIPRNFAVISAPDAAGYRDFIKHLDENPYGFSIWADLYPALMQGADCPASIIDAMDSVMQSGVTYDAVLILRGGGSKLDLSCFDDYSLAAAIAQYSLPVMTAIGHDQDYHVCDMTAHRNVKTPTALADFILEIFEDEDSRLLSLENRMRLAFVGKLAVMESVVDALGVRVRSAVSLRFSQMEHRLQMLQSRIEAADPKRILERGYAYLADENGVVIKSTTGQQSGGRVSVFFADGQLDCVIEKVIEN